MKKWKLLRLEKRFLLGVILVFVLSLILYGLLYGFKMEVTIW